tara:strand:+ start:676 stop:1548 length:873 start_codon:yes stop_codon:yes gene_type:complete
VTGSTRPPTLAERVQFAAHRLVDAGLSGTDATVDAEVLARHILSWTRSRYLSALRDPVPAGLGAAYDALIARRCQREPVSQITGGREFWGRNIRVTRDVLTPRPETELLVEVALELVPAFEELRVLDLGTGSGCLAVTLAAELPASRVTAVDLSPVALEVARSNAIRHGVTERIEFVEGDWTNGLAGDFHLIVSNPPYVRDADTDRLQPEVRDYEPWLALTAGPDGLDAFRNIVEGVGVLLAPDGRLLLELGAGQAKDLRALVEARGTLRVTDIRDDLQGIPRAAVVRRA